jgi:MFS family permease
MILGTVYISGNVGVYFASYLRIDDSSVTLAEVNTLLPLQLAVSTLFIAVGTQVYLRFGAKVTTALGNGIVITAVFCTSFVNSLAGYLLLYGGVYGMGVGLSVSDRQYTAPLMLSWSHFPQYKARISGIVIGGYGLGSAIFNLVATKLVNPDNASPHDKEKDGGVTYHYFKKSIAENVPEMLRWLSLLYLVFSVIGILLLTKKSQYEVTEETSEVAPSVKAAVKTKQFLVLSIAAQCSTCTS